LKKNVNFKSYIVVEIALLIVVLLLMAIVVLQHVVLAFVVHDMDSM
jgi:hypothetical protein